MYNVSLSTSFQDWSFTMKRQFKICNVKIKEQVSRRKHFKIYNVYLSIHAYNINNNLKRFKILVLWFKQTVKLIERGETDFDDNRVRLGDGY